MAEETKPKTQAYLSLVTFATDTERWLPGSRIELTDEKALIHLQLGNVLPLDDTVPPIETPPAFVVHEEAVEPAPEKPAKASKP